MADKKITINQVFWIPLLIGVFSGILTGIWGWAFNTYGIRGAGIALLVGAILLGLAFWMSKRSWKKNGLTGFTILPDVYPHD